MLNKKLILFISKAIGLLLVWIFAYELWLKQDGRIDNWLTALSAKHSEFVLQTAGFDIHSQLTASGEAMIMDGEVLLYIAHSCNGLILYALFSGFIFLYGNVLWKKFAFVVPGILLIYCLNVTRIIALCLIQLNRPDLLNISHKYIFTIIVYAAIFGLWMLWANYGSHNKNAASASDKTLTHA